MQIAEVILDNDIGKPLDYIITKEIKDKIWQKVKAENMEAAGELAADKTD